ncbi:MAG: hypothetical protein SF187_05760 [Deltaproteobacteria bacterium]|nr:hypothetical protein [Deltaproteobacteria bacterium]
MGSKVGAMFVIGTLLAGCASGSSQQSATVLFRDQFDQLRPGAFSHPIGPRSEYHYLPEVAPRQGWTISNHLWEGSQWSWRVVERNGQAGLAQTYDNPYPHWHPMVVAGDPLWREYTANAVFETASNKRVGLAVHYLHDRVYVFVGIEAGRFLIKTVNHESTFHQPDERILASAPHAQSSGPSQLVVQVHGPDVVATLAGHTMRASVPGLSHGRIAVVASGPATFFNVTVTAPRDAAQRLAQAQAHRQQDDIARNKKYPAMKLWRTISTLGFGVGRNMRIGDLDNDGQKELILGQVQHHGPADAHAELSCLTAMRLDGSKLWQIGEPDPYRHHLTNDVAWQIHDLDGDGKTEVIYTMNQRIFVADGRSGKTLREAPTPAARPAPGQVSKFPRILGDALLIADLQGKGHPTSLVLKDRYENVWVYDDQLQPRWSAPCNTGHFPFAHDINNDGHQELLAGYCFFGPNGEALWSWEKQLQDHADGVAIVRLGGPNAPLDVVMVASDEGLLLGDTAGNVKVHHRIGHAQSASVANYRDDLPGLEIVVSDFWGNQGIILIFDAQGRLIKQFEPMQAGSPVVPINWSGGKEELFALAADVNEGGLFDGHGERAVRFPADGHPDQTFAVADLTGDARDEILVWDPSAVWIYTQDQPAAGPVERRRRSDELNQSNYQIVVSVPKSY